MAFGVSSIVNALQKLAVGDEANGQPIVNKRIEQLVSSLSSFEVINYLSRYCFHARRAIIAFTSRAGDMGSSVIRTPVAW